MNTIISKYKRYISITVFFLIVLLFFSITKFKNNASGMTGFILCFAFLLAFYSLFFRVCKITGVNGILSELNNKSKWTLAFICCFSALMLITILTKERYVYFWDFGGYWGISIDHSIRMFEEPAAVFKELYISINSQEYNNLIPVLLALPLKLFGTDFSIYALLIFVMFIMPTCIVLYAYSIRLCTTLFGNSSQISFIMSGILIAGTSAFYMPVYLGYLDAFSLLTLMLVYQLLYDIDFSKRNIGKDIHLAIFIILTLLGRRYFAFAIMGIAIPTFLLFIIEIFRAKSKDLIQGYLENAFLICFFTIVPLCLFFKDFILNSLKGTIKIAYSAYQTGNYIWNYEQLIKYFGIFQISLIILLILYMLCSKKYNKNIFLHIVSFIVSSSLFFNVQSMGNHHYYIVVIPLTIMMIAGFNFLYNLKHKILYYLIVFLLCMNIYCFLDGSGVPSQLLTLFTNQRMQPKTRDDIPVLQLLANELNGYSANNESSYLIASSTIINDDMIRKVYMPDMLITAPMLSVSSHVDLRDGFPRDFFHAKYVLVASPVQYHLSPDNQRVVGILAAEFLENGTLSKHFSLIEEYEITNGVKIFVYKKQSDYTVSDKIYVADLFNEYYSDYPELFEQRILE